MVIGWEICPAVEGRQGYKAGHPFSTTVVYANKLKADSNSVVSLYLSLEPALNVLSQDRSRGSHARPHGEPLRTEALEHGTWNMGHGIRTEHTTASSATHPASWDASAPVAVSSHVISSGGEMRCSSRTSSTQVRVFTVREVPDPILISVPPKTQMRRLLSSGCTSACPTNASHGAE